MVPAILLIDRITRDQIHTHRNEATNCAMAGVELSMRQVGTPPARAHASRYFRCSVPWLLCYLAGRHGLRSDRHGAVAGD